MLNLLKAWQVNAQNDNFIDAFTNSSTTYFGSLLLTPTKSFVLYVVLSYPVGMVCTYQGVNTLYLSRPLDGYPLGNRAPEGFQRESTIRSDS